MAITLSSSQVERQWVPTASQRAALEPQECDGRPGSGNALSKLKGQEEAEIEIVIMSWCISHRVGTCAFCLLS